MVETGIPLGDSQDLSKIKFKGSVNIFKNLDIISNINVQGKSDFLLEDITGIIFKESNGISIYELSQKYPNLANVTIPDGVTSIGDYAIMNCKNLKSIELPKSLTSIGKDAFNRCTGLTSIIIPDSVTEIGQYAFTNCTSLTSIDLPGSISVISGNAFSYCSGLTNVVIQEGVTIIDKEAFRDCSSLISVNIPKSVISVGKGSFSYCPNLKTINYAGTQEQWKVLSATRYWNYESPTDMVINCNYQGETYNI